MNGAAATTAPKKGIRKSSPMKFFFKVIRRAALLLSKASIDWDIRYHVRRSVFGYAIVPVNGHRMYLDLKNDSGISKDLFIFRKREHLSTDFLLGEQVLRPGDTALDIGANIGYYVLIESSLVGPKGTVYAIEPVSINYSLLQKNIELNRLANVRTFHLAAGNEPGEAEIYVGKKGNFSSFIYHAGESYTGTEKVQIVTIDEFVRTHHIRPDLVRMDVEGFEIAIIQGMRETLAHKPKLLIEVHPHIMTREQLEEMFSIIHESGYTNVVEIKDKNEIWMKRSGEIRPSLRYLSSKLSKDGYALGMGKITRMSLAELRQTLPERGSAFHVLLS